MPAKVLTEQSTLDWLRDTAATIPADQAIVELGVYQGGSLKYLVEGTRAGNNAPVYGVDIWGVGATYRSRPHLARAYGPQNMRIAAANAPSATLIRGESQHTARHWTGPAVALLFIDAEHSYRNAAGDFQAWRKHLTPAAWVVWDDYWVGRFPGVIQAVDELVNTGVLTGFTMIGARAAATRLA